MWQELTQGTRENQGPSNYIGLVREVNGGGREAKEEGVEGRMVETGVGAQIRRLDVGNRGQAEWDGEPEQSQSTAERKVGKGDRNPCHQGAGEQGNGQGCIPGSRRKAGNGGEDRGGGGEEGPACKSCEQWLD